MGIRKSQNLGKWLVALLLLMVPVMVLAEMTDASKQHLETLRGMEVRLSKDPAKKVALEKVRSEIHRIEKEYRLPLSKFSPSNGAAAGTNSANGSSGFKGATADTARRRPQYQDFSENSKRAEKDSATEEAQKAQKADPMRESKASNAHEENAKKKKTAEANSTKQADEGSFTNKKTEEDAALRERARRAYQQTKDIKGRRVVGYDQFGKPEYEYDCQSSFSMIL